MLAPFRYDWRIERTVMNQKHASGAFIIVGEPTVLIPSVLPHCSGRHLILPESGIRLRESLYSTTDWLFCYECYNPGPGGNYHCEFALSYRGP
jgi:hypothetical protein